MKITHSPRYSCVFLFATLLVTTLFYGIPSTAEAAAKYLFPKNSYVQIVAKDKMGHFTRMTNMPALRASKSKPNGIVLGEDFASLYDDLAAAQKAWKEDIAIGALKPASVSRVGKTSEVRRAVDTYRIAAISKSKRPGRYKVFIPSEELGGKAKKTVFVSSSNPELAKAKAELAKANAIEAWQGWFRDTLGITVK